MFIFIGVVFLLLTIFVFYNDWLSMKKNEVFAKERKDRHMQSLADMDKERRIKWISLLWLDWKNMIINILEN